jgi:ribosomal protein L11 methyltransferase
MELRAPPVSTVWRILARVRGADAASAVFSLLDEVAGAVSAFETAPGEWRVEAYPRSPVLGAELDARLALAAAAAGGALVETGEERLPGRDWLAENQLAFPPMRIGRFFVYGSHYLGDVPAGAIGVAVDAATAFGTGEHPSTRGCLIALERLARRHRLRRLLDIGSGTGILSIAAAKLLHCNVLASDIDPGAVAVAQNNVVRNGVSSLVRVRDASGYRSRGVRRSRFDLVLSNILARPLADMAFDLARALAPGGRAVLSGLLCRQEPIVLTAHRSCGIILEGRVVVEGWSTLILRSRPKSEMKMGAAAPILESRLGGLAVRLPSAARTCPGCVTGSAAKAALACEHPRQARRFANGEFRYRLASDRRASLARHKPAPGAANRRRLSRPRRAGLTWT